MALFGGNPENMDRDAALAAFLATFKTEDKKIRDKLLIDFLKGFMRSHKESREAVLTLAEKGDPHQGHILKQIYSAIIQKKFMLGLGSSYDYLSFASSSQTERATKQGEMLGAFLAFIEYGVSSTDQKIQSDINLYQDFIPEIRKLPLILKESGISIKRGFIANRVKQIARKKAGKLTDRQQKVLSEIASMFW